MTSITNSATLVQEHEQRVATEVAQLLVDIRRIGGNADNCRFGDLFDDEHVQQYYEALVGTLQSAKKKGYIQYPGRLLLKGVSDAVVITIVKDDAATGTKE